MLTPDTLPDAPARARRRGRRRLAAVRFSRPATRSPAACCALEGMTTRRVFAWIPREGHAARARTRSSRGRGAAGRPSGRARSTSSWRSLESRSREMVSGKRVAMEYSRGRRGAVSRPRAGRRDRDGARGGCDGIVSSGELVSRFYAVVERRAHRVARARGGEDRDDRARSARARRRARAQPASRSPSTS